MPQQEVSHWLGIDLILKHKTDLTTATVFLTNKANLYPGNADGNTTYLPLIVGGTRIGTASDREIVLPVAGSIKIDNSIGSFGVDRKLSDLFERYELVDQVLVLTYGVSEVGVTRPETNLTGFIGKVLDWTHAIDQGQPVIEIRFDSRKIPKRIINRKIESDSISSAPLSSIGKYLPVVFGSAIQVRPIRITQDSLTRTPQFAYATTLNNEHGVGGVSAYYAKTNRGNYAQVLGATAAGTAVFSETAGATNTDVSSNEKCFSLKSTVNTNYNYILTHVDVGFHGWGVGATYDGAIAIKILDGEDAIPGTQVLATGTVNAADYDTSFDAAPDFYITFNLDKPVVLESDKAYWISIIHQYITANPISITNSSGSGLFMHYRTTTGNAWVRSTQKILNVKAYGVQFTDTATGLIVDDAGLGMAYFTADERSTTYYPDLTKLDLIVAVNGLKDDSGGNITGSASSQINTIHHAIKLLSQTWSGSAWSLDTTNWDFSEYSDTYFSTNTIGGCTDGETTFEQWLRQACRNSATKCVLLNNGKIAPYSWGTTRSSAATLTQENSKVTRLEQLDSSYVVNRTTVAYARALIYFDSIIAASQGIASDYTLIMNRNVATSAEYELLIENSVDIYGSRELAEIYFNWINDGTAATRVSRFYLTNYKEPPKYAEVEAPFNEFSTLKLMNVVTVINPSLPNYYGGIPNAKLPHYLGDIADDANAGYNLCEAQSYRAQIESRTLTFNEDSAPTLNLVCRLLTNYPNDPT